MSSPDKKSSSWHIAAYSFEVFEAMLERYGNAEAAKRNPAEIQRLFQEAIPPKTAADVIYQIQAEQDAWLTAS